MSKFVASAATNVTIGIDVSNDRLDVCVQPEGVTQQVPNDRAGHARLDYAKEADPSHFEATGAHQRGLQKTFAKAGLPSVKVNPWQPRRFAEATGRRAKTDPVDAAML